MSYLKLAQQALDRQHEPPDMTPAELPPDWFFLWEERAAIMEYDGGLAKEHAEAAALADIVRRMLDAGIDLMDGSRLATGNGDKPPA